MRRTGVRVVAMASVFSALLLGGLRAPAAATGPVAAATSASAPVVARMSPHAQAALRRAQSASAPTASGFVPLGQGQRHRPLTVSHQP